MNESLENTKVVLENLEKGVLSNPENIERNAESLEQKLNENIKKIETYSEQITDIPDRQEKQITELGGNQGELADEMITVNEEVKRTKSGFIDRTKNTVIALGTLFASIGSMTNSNQKTQVVSPAQTKVIEINPSTKEVAKKDATTTVNPYNVSVQGINTSESTRTKLTPKDKVIDLDTIKQQKEIQKRIEEKNQNQSFIKDGINLFRGSLNRVEQKATTNYESMESLSTLSLEDHGNPFEIYFGNEVKSSLGDKFELSAVYMPLQDNNLSNPNIDLGVYNRGDYLGKGKIEFKRTLINAFDDNSFKSVETYNLNKDDTNTFYVGLNKNGQLINGYAKDILEKATTVDKIASFSVIKNIKEFDLSKRVTAVKTVEGNRISLNIINGSKNNEFGGLRGGSLLLLSPDHSSVTLVSGSIQNIKDGLEFFKKKHNVAAVDVVKLDNGTFANSLQTRDGTLEQDDLDFYKMRNTSGSHNIFLKKLK